MHCGLLLLFTFYSNTTNSDKNTLFGTFFDKNQTKRARIIKGWFKYMTDCKNFPDSWCDTNPLMIYTCMHANMINF
jgi:hypothetical protein